MGNLFLKERESWWTWIVWGLIGSIVNTYIFSSTSDVKFALVSSTVSLAMLSIWMNYSRRFDFYRALKVLLFVSSISLLPIALNVALPFKELASHGVNFTLVLLGFFFLCLCGAWFARRPKQYY
jgi:hypothetical protein